MKQLQMTFDHGKRHELIRLAGVMADHVDIIEIGYPELITFGLDLVREIHEAHPDVKLCADAKVFHGGSGVTRRCFDAGADRVYVIDGHGRGENFLPGLLDERAKQISIAELTDVVKGLSCAVLIGMHAMSGTTNAFLDHTQSSLKIHRYFYNGKEIGEMAQIGGYLGHFGVSCVAVSGDAAACREARKFFGDKIFTAEVKTAKCRNLAECLPYDEASSRIYGAVFDGVSNPEKNKPLKFSLPLKITVEFNRADYCEDACRSECVKG
jgi:D-amino peptidase